MATPERIRAYASHLFALAIRAREGGDVSHADRLVVRAAEYLDEATAAVTVTQQQPQQAAQQQQQPQPKKE